MKNYLKRMNPRYPSAIIATILVIPLFIIIMLGHEPGRIFGSIVMIIGAMFASYEFLRHMRLHKLSKLLIPLLTIAVFLIDKEWMIIELIGNKKEMMNSYTQLTHIIGLSTALIPAITLTLVFFDPVAKQEQQLLRTYLYTTFITIAAGLFFRALFAISVVDWRIVLLLAPVAIISDTFAYIGGSLLGKKFPQKMSPKISPKKTWAGFIVGYIFATVYIVLYVYFTDIFTFSNGNYLIETFSSIPRSRYIILFVFLALALPMVSPTGDLVFSSFKREMGIKDYGKIMPGHGGLLDRIDSWIFIVITFSIIFEMLAW